MFGKFIFGGVLLSLLLPVIAYCNPSDEEWCKRNTSGTAASPRASYHATANYDKYSKLCHNHKGNYKYPTSIK